MFSLLNTGHLQVNQYKGRYRQVAARCGELESLVVVRWRSSLYRACSVAICSCISYIFMLRHGNTIYTLILGSWVSQFSYILMFLLFVHNYTF